MSAYQRQLLWKYLRILILLCGLIAVNLMVTRWIGWPTETEAPQLTQEQTAQEGKLALQRLEKLTASDAARVQSAAGQDVWQKAELLFSGLPDAQTTRKVLDALRSNGQDAVFFVGADDVTAHPDSLVLIYEAGYSIGAALSADATARVASSAEEAVPALADVELRIKAATGIWPGALLYEGDSPPEALPLYAAACGFQTVYEPGAYFRATEGSPAQQAEEAMRTLRRGALLCVALGGGNAVAEAFPPLAQALRDSDLSAQAQALCRKNGGAQANVATRVFTSERAVAFTFSGMRSGSPELTYVLDALGALQGTGLFLLAPDAPQNSETMVREILAAGQEVGLALVGARYQTAQEAVCDILRAQEVLADTYGYHKLLPVSTAFASPSELVREAASAVGLPLIASLYAPVRTADIRETQISSLIAKLRQQAGATKLQRGEIVHYQMSQYQKSERLLGELVTAVANEDNLYPIGSLVEMLQNPAVYTYPLPKEAMLASVRDVIHPGQLTGDVLPVAQERYIGNPFYNYPGKMPGFTRQEIRTLNKDGLVRNDQHLIFLTFDDWGSDRTVTRLLDVFAAHHATGTFFVRTNNVHYNPNLLRAIAMDGHTVGSHTHKHLPLSNAAESKGTNAESLTPAQAETLRDDLVLSWDALQGIIGDVTVQGRPALVPLFRPPTLAVSRIGLETVFDCGFHYVVNGSLTTQDYAAESAETLYKRLVSHTTSGAVFVMHMSDNSAYTAEAVDMYLTYLETFDGGVYQARGLNYVLE